MSEVVVESFLGMRTKPCVLIGRDLEDVNDGNGAKVAARRCEMEKSQFRSSF